MALNKVALLPDLHDLLRLFSRKDLSLLHNAEPLVNRWFLADTTGTAVELFVGIEQVARKFECFGLLLQALDETARLRLSDATPIGDIGAPAFTFWIEWEWTAPPTASNEPFGHTMAASGSLADVSEDATSACVSLISISWASEISGTSRRHAIYHDVAWMPTDLVYTNDADQVETLVASGTTIPLRELETWYSTLQAWLGEGPLVSA